MRVQIEKAANGYIIKTLDKEHGFAQIGGKQKYVFGNISSAFTWLRGRFGEEDKQETQGSTTSEPPPHPPVPDSKS